MSPLLLFDVTVAEASQAIGVFGSSIPVPVNVDHLLREVQGISSEWHVTLQLVDATYVAGPQHLVFATNHALNAFHYGTQRASDLALEILRFAAAQRQIHRAVAKLGVRVSTRQMGGVLLGGTPEVLKKAYGAFLNRTGSKDTLSALEISSNEKEAALQEVFCIDSKELRSMLISPRARDRRQALQKLVYDRCALLAITQ